MQEFHWFFGQFEDTKRTFCNKLTCKSLLKILQFLVAFLENLNFNRESKRANFYTPFPSGGGGARMNKKSDAQGKLEKSGGALFTSLET